MKNITLQLTIVAGSLFILLCSPALSIGPGEKAPGFTIETTQGVVSLADFAGEKNVVLAFYFRAFTPVWSNEILAFQRDLEEFTIANAQVIGISGDSIDTLQRFTKENSITFPLAFDGKKSVQKLYQKGRITFIVDKQGIIQFVQEGVPDNQLLLDELKKLQ